MPRDQLHFVFEEYGAYHAVLGCKADRPNMEDTAATFCNLKNFNEPTIFAVFDGHGGSNCSKFCRDSLPEALSKHPELKTNPKRALKETFLEVDAQYCRLAREYNDLDDGSTATVLLISHDKSDNTIKYYLASAGDSRSILIKKTGEVIALSHDHSLERTDEADRIISCGGEIRKDDFGSRVVSETVGELSVTRAIGDAEFKNIGVIAEPEISEGILDESVFYIILASDGLWGQVSNEETGEFFLNPQTGTKLSTKIENLIKVAKQRDNTLSDFHKESHSCDNVTILAVNVPHMLEKLNKHLETEERLKKAEKAERLKRHQNKNKETITIAGLDPNGYLAELLLWKNPLRTALWFFVGCLVYFLLEIAKYNILSLISYLLITRLLVNTFVVKFSPVLKKLGVFDKDFDEVVFLNEGMFFTEEVIDRTANLMHKFSKTLFDRWHMIVYEASPKRVLVSLRYISYFFTPLSLPTLLFIGFISAFSLIATYDRNKAFFDRKYTSLLSSFYAFMYRVGLR